MERSLALESPAGDCGITGRWGKITDEASWLLIELIWRGCERSSGGSCEIGVLALLAGW